MNWYALFVKPGSELITKKWINLVLDTDFQCIVPQRKLIETKNKVSKEVTKVIFPNYVFIKINMSYNIYHSLKKIPSLVKILHYSSYYTEIPEEEMEPILKITSQDEVVGISNILLDSNSQISYISGPLKNSLNLIKKINKHKKRASVYFNLMGQERKIDFSINILHSH